MSCGALRFRPHALGCHASITRLLMLVSLVCTLTCTSIINVQAYVQDPPYIPVVTGDTTTPSGILASGYAMCYDGIDDVITVNDIRPVITNPGTVDELSINAQQGTMSLWFNTPTPGGGIILGFPYGAGPFLGKGTSTFPDGTSKLGGWIQNPMTKQPGNEIIWHTAGGMKTATYWNDTDGTIWPTPYGPELPNTWYHMVQTWDSLRSEVYVNGYLEEYQVRINTSVPFKVSGVSAWSGKQFMVAPQAFKGCIDEVRYFNRRFDMATIQSMYNRAALTPTERASLLVHMNFDDQATVATDSSGRGWQILMGNGLASATPKYQVSTAPQVGTQLNYAAKQRPSTMTPSDPAWIVPLLVQHTYGVNATVQLRISNITFKSSEGTLMDGNKQPIVFDPNTINDANPLLVAGNQLYFMPAVGRSSSVGVIIAKVALDVLSAQPNIRSQTVTLQLDITPNSAPKPGNGGMAISCDGSDDFMFTPKFDWPVKTYQNSTGGNVTGAAPITVEFWAWIDKTSEIDGCAFSVGNSFTADPGVTGTPYNNRGQFHARFPSKTQRMAFTAGMDPLKNIQSPLISQFYGSWAHYAFVHEGAGGTLTQVFVNGVLQSQSTHNHDGNANPDWRKNELFVPVKPNLLGLSICTWTHYSDIYHRGLIDDFRIWQGTRTQMEIARDMNKQLVGNEPKLFGYWDFNDGPDEYAITGDQWAAMDRTSNGNHLVYGGCGPCEDYFMGYTVGKNLPAGITLPAQTPGVVQTVGGVNITGVRQCVPSAQATTSRFFDQALSLGAILCYGDNVNPSTRPTRLVSTAPIGGFHFPVKVPYQGTKMIQLNATDTESDTLLFQVARLPYHGKVFYSLDFGVNLIPFNTSNTWLPTLKSTVWYTASPGAGGANYDSFTYRVGDGIAISDETTIDVSVLCPSGTTSAVNVPGASVSDVAASTCLPCPAGSYSAFESYSACTPCPLGYYQSLTGQRECRSCRAGKTYTSTVGATSCQTCDSSAPLTGRLVLSEARCEQGMTVPPGGSAFTIGLNSESDQSMYVSQLKAYSKGPQVKWNTASDAVCQNPSYNQTVPLSSASNPTRTPQLTAYITALPRYGDLYQKATGQSLSESFRGSLADPILQWPTCIINASPARPKHGSSTVLGRPDTLGYGSSSSAWSPIGSPLEHNLVYVDVSYDTPVYASGVQIFETYNPGCIYTVEAYNAQDGTWFTMWQKSTPYDTTVIDPYNPQYLGQRINVFSPQLCATLFPTNRLRVTLWLSQTVGAPEIDAIGLVGVANQEDLPLAWVPLTKVDTSSTATPQLDLAYKSASPDQVGGSSYSDSLAYVLTSCESLPYSVKRTSVIVVDIQPTLQVLSAGVGVTFSIISCAGIVVSLAMMVFIIINNQAAIFKASSSSSLILNLFSVALLFLQALLINLQGMYPESMGNYCQYNSFLFGFASSVLFASLLAKTYRLHSIFNATKLSKIQALNDSILFAGIAVIYSVDLLINLIWYGIDALHPELKIKETSAQSYYQCDSKHYSAFEGTHYCTKAALLACLLFVSVKVRNLPSRYNEARSIGMVAYNATFFAVLAIVVMQFIKDNINASYAIQDFGLLSVAWGCIGFFYTPKFYAYFYGMNDIAHGQHASDLKTQNNTNKTNSSSLDQPQKTSSGGIIDPNAPKHAKTLSTGSSTLSTVTNARGRGSTAQTSSTLSNAIVTPSAVRTTRAPSFPLAAAPAPSNVTVSNNVAPNELPQSGSNSSPGGSEPVEPNSPEVSPQDIQLQLATSTEAN